MVKNRDREAGVYSIHEAKTQLSRLLDRVLATGQPILIGRRGKAEVMLSPLNDAPTTRRTPGLYRSGQPRRRSSATVVNATNAGSVVRRRL